MMLLNDKISEERMDEILEMSREINDSNLVYEFKNSSIFRISFIEFRRPMYTNDQLMRDEKTLQQVEKEQKN